MSLEMENVQYATWAELFKIHARSHRVIDHIIPLQDGKQKAPPTEEETKLWLTLDAPFYNGFMPPFLRIF